VYDLENGKRLAEAARKAMDAVYNWMREPDWAKEWNIYAWTARRPVADVRSAQAIAASLLDAVGEIERLREAVADERSVLDAWFDRRKLGHAAVDAAVLGAAKGYLRTCSNGGMPKKQVDAALAVIEDMARLSIFADLYARALLGGDHDNG